MDGDGVGAASAELTALAEDLRQAVGQFVRGVRLAAGTPRESWPDTLGHLDRQGPMTVAALARLRGVRHQSMRVTAAQLEAGGLVLRTPDPDDARGQTVAITDAGRAALLQSRAARTQWIAAGLRDYANAAEREALRNAIAVLRRLADGGPGVSQP